MSEKKKKPPVPVGESGFPAVHDLLVPKAIWFTNGVGVHKDRLSSFELALRDADVEIANLVTVSSNGTSVKLRARITSDLPAGAVRIPRDNAAGLHELVEVVK